ncbi:hypothetical protein Tco_1179654 [Tanacetum coccineum]
MPELLTSYGGYGDFISPTLHILSIHLFIYLFTEPLAQPYFFSPWQMPPRSSNRRNNRVDPAFTSTVEQAVIALLPTLTARITDKIHQNENNGNNDNRRNARHGSPRGSENWIAYVKKIFEILGCDDQFKAKLATYEGDAHSWWRAYKQAKGGDAYVATLPWNDFRDIFFL